MQTQTLTNQLNEELTRRGWTTDHPRIRSFLSKSSQKLGRSIATVSVLPEKYLAHLIKLVNAFGQCQHLLQILGIDWKDPQVLSHFAKYGNSAQMPFQGWSELIDALDQRWFESGGGF